ncbi:DMT family transporter [Parvibium lacunae]|uniref:DMT family transporter n=1 Tax=Parvibium lacunae TaxID=1888893 RepID=A0A368L7C0_9BURK|nr:DMT family transporter [Parvibium lacunae]RCS59560.1 DMT family transporter [Parvibium lacunae]
MQRREYLSAIASLLTGATIWGLIWFPYRFLAQQGISGTLASALTYSIGLMLAASLYTCLCWRLPAYRAERFFSWPLLGLGLAVGLTNVSFVWATIHGAVLRVVLLFYLCPVWTAFFAHFLLREPITPRGVWVILLGLFGALVMLWQPDQGWPFPQTLAEWVGLGAGIMFALSNVLLRKIRQPTRELKTCWVLLGCALVGLVGAAVEGGAKPALSIAIPHSVTALVLVCLLLLGGVLVLANWVVQFGIERLPANKVAVIYLFELIVAGASGWLLAAEHFGWQEFAGACLIACASVLAARE